MRMITLSEAQKHLPELVVQAREAVIGLIDETGRLTGLLAGVSEEDLDDLLVQTAAFQTMISRSRDSLQGGPAVPAQDLLAEAESELPEGPRRIKSST